MTYSLRDKYKNNSINCLNKSKNSKNKEKAKPTTTYYVDENNYSHHVVDESDYSHTTWWMKVTIPTPI